MLWLALGPFRAMENQVLVIRIKIPNSGAVDWTVHSGPQLLFRDVLDVIGQVLPEATTTAFELLLHSNGTASKWPANRAVADISKRQPHQLYCSCATPLMLTAILRPLLSLLVLPATPSCKPPGERNIHGLKVNTRAGPSQHTSPVVSDSLPSNSLKKSSAELRKILANGQMNEQDIRYRDTLGHGNGGTVYKAYHVPSGKILAVKVILLDITLELQKQIMSELEILYKCDSSYIIGFYGAFFVENRISICTEFMDGGSLDVYRKIPEHVLGRIAVAVVKGLTYLWSLKILHRDVKPSNMLVNTGGQVKLCDFGVSTQLVNSIAKTYVGTNAYMALALGRFPYPQIQKNQGSLMPLQLLQCIVDEDSPVLPLGEFSEPFVHFITQCMRKQPKERPAPEELMEMEVEESWKDRNLKFTCSGMLNELGLAVCLGFRVTSRMVATPADLCPACPALSPLSARPTSPCRSSLNGLSEELPPTPLERAASRSCSRTSQARDPALVNKVDRGQGSRLVSTSVLHRHVLPGPRVP
ncbi:dual specificity mitogen-activated protein kinase kinase 5 isoform X7 [Meriones unguiculatus]|uniref:dual specificity mitogen-activated protein kinase kinase 5 isoform X7 n=1 Tax=Meriones unguiculatus TaxID=10047 RepID=UPI00293E81A3|nr:dual specificity mitogen-activated protein kinase kinase 5 isoform X7 [Meriones unguiculatus]